MTTSPARRTVLRATAWMAPAVVVVAAAPAFATSTPPSEFRINATPDQQYPWEPEERGLTISVTNPTASPLPVSVFIPNTEDPEPWSVYQQSWRWNGYNSASQSYVLTTSVASFTTSPTFSFAWYSRTPVVKNVTLTATAPGFDPAVAVVPLRFDQTPPTARRAPASPSEGLRLNR